MPTETPQPLYLKVKNHLLARIQSGEWQPNQRLPSEHELMAQFGVSRMTANRAVRELTDEGRLVRLQGVGTFVAQPKAQSALFEVHSIAAEIEKRGHRHSCRVLSVVRAAADAGLAAAFNVAEGSMLFHTVMVHDEDGVPIQYEDRWVNPAVAPDYLQQDFSRQTAHDYLVSVAPWHEGEHTVEAVLPAKAVAEALKIGRSEPCLLIGRRTWSGGQIATVVRLWFPGKRHRLSGRFQAQR